jgi:coenzyme F420 biosynthesis associated uncharacterized protein
VAPRPVDATQVDWSMGSRAARLADWDTALRVGRMVAGTGASVPADDRARMRRDFAEVVPQAEELISAFTGLAVRGFRSRAWVMGRTEWMRANISGLQRAVEPLAERMLATNHHRGDVRRKSMGAQAGALLGYAAKRVLGQYDVFLPADDEGLLYFVGPNVADVERRFGLEPRAFRLWIALHEVTHRVQFDAASWLSGFFRQTLDRYLGTVSLDPRELFEQLRRALEQARAGEPQMHDLGPIGLLLTPEQREIFLTMQGTMSLLEGHASYVMNEVARGHVEHVDRMQRALDDRRHPSGPRRTIQRAIGFEQKVRQYDLGERFVRRVIDEIGMSGLNLVWDRPEHLPTVDDIADPSRWITRVAGT